MKLLSILVFGLSFFTYSELTKERKIHSFSLNSVKGKIHFKDYKNKVLIISNIATHCGHSKQLKEYQKLINETDKKFGRGKIAIVAVPTNDFGRQSPGSDKDIKNSCIRSGATNYPVSEKIVSKGEKRHPLFSFLIKESGGSQIRWNFEKFIFSSDGKFIKKFPSSVSPLSPKFKGLIEKLIN